MAPSFNGQPWRSQYEPEQTVGSALRFVPWQTSPSARGLTVRRRLGFGRTPVKHRFGNEAK